MPTPAQEAAAQFLLAARKSGKPGPRIPADIRPADVADALAVQRRVGELIGQPVGGWKCSVPTEPRPIACAAIFAPTIVRHSPCPVITSANTAKIEPEIAFVLDTRSPRARRPYDEEVRGALREARFVLELMGSRYADPSATSFRNCWRTAFPIKAADGHSLPRSSGRSKAPVLRHGSETLIQGGQAPGWASAAAALARHHLPSAAILTRDDRDRLGAA
jgi:2-keto-4-pentenoate hydratase